MGAKMKRVEKRGGGERMGRGEGGKGAGRRKMND